MNTENYPNTAPLQFLPHMSWDRRGEVPKSPGIYAISKGTPENLIYVGLTQQTGGLRGRLGQFHRSATTGMHNHAGGVTYHKLFGPEVSGLIFTVHLAEIPKTSPLDLSDYLRTAERSAIWQHIARHGRPPACNKT